MSSSTTSTISAKAAKEAEAYKQKGNALYQQGNFAAALEFYTKATARAPAEPVYVSNQSACYYEMGKYVESAEAAAKCLSLLEQKEKEEKKNSQQGNGGGDKTPATAAAVTAIASLRQKNRRRRAFAMAYAAAAAAADSTSHTVDYAGIILLAEEALATGSAADNMLEHLLAWARHYQQQGEQQQQENPSENHEKEAAVSLLDCLYLCRGALLPGLLEFFPVGHDDVKSCCSGETYQKPRDDAFYEKPGTGINLYEEDKHLSFFFGGVGDGRHVFGTFRDLYLRCSGQLMDYYNEGGDGKKEEEKSSGGGGGGGGNNKKNKKKKRTRDSSSSSPSFLPPAPIPSVSLVMNDITSRALARDLVIIAASLDYLDQLDDKEKNGCGGSVYPDTMQAILEAKNLYNMGGLVYGLYLSPLLLPHDVAWLLAFLRRASACAKPEDLFPWLHADEKTWRAVCEAFQGWIEVLEEGIISTETMQAFYMKGVKGQDINEKTLEIVRSVDATGEYAHCMEMRRMKKDQLVAFVRKMEMTQEMVDDRNNELEEGEPRYTAESLKKQMINEAKQYTVRDIEMLEEIPEAAAEIRHHVCTGRTVTLAMSLKENRKYFKGGSEALKLLKPNATMLNSLEWFAHHADPGFSYGPFENIGSFFRQSHKQDQALLQGYPCYILGTLFLAEAARGIKMILSGGKADNPSVSSSPRLHVQLMLGDVYAAAQAAPSIRPDLFSSYDRILCSNINDYTTLLPTFIYLLPRLKPFEEGVTTRPATLTYNVLLSTGRFADIKDYTRRSILVNSMEEASSLFGLGLRWGDLHAVEAHWSFTPPSSAGGPKPLSAAATSAYLKRLLKSIVLPPKRDSRQQSPEHRPLSLKGFLEVFPHFVRIGSVATHLLVGFLETLLQEQEKMVLLGEGQGGRGQAISSSTSSSFGTNLSFYYELKALCCLYAASGDAPFTLLSLPCLFNKTVKTYTLSLNMSPLWEGEETPEGVTVGMFGRTKDPVLGVAFVQGEGTENEEGGGDLSNFFSRMMMGGMMGGRGKNLLDMAKKKEKEGKVVHVLSTSIWFSRGEVTFALCTEDFERMCDGGSDGEAFSVLLYRTDDYQILSIPTPIDEAGAVLLVDW